MSVCSVVCIMSLIKQKETRFGSFYRTTLLLETNPLVFGTDTYAMKSRFIIDSIQTSDKRIKGSDPKFETTEFDL